MAEANSMSSSSSSRPVFKNGNSSRRATDLDQQRLDAEAEKVAARKKEEERIKQALADFEELKTTHNSLKKQLEEAKETHSHDLRVIKDLGEQLDASNKSAKQWQIECAGYQDKLKQAEFQIETNVRQMQDIVATYTKMAERAIRN